MEILNIFKLSVLILLTLFVFMASNNFSITKKKKRRKENKKT